MARKNVFRLQFRAINGGNFARVTLLNRSGALRIDRPREASSEINRALEHLLSRLNKAIKHESLEQMRIKTSSFVQSNPFEYFTPVSTLFIDASLVWISRFECICEERKGELHLELDVEPFLDPFRALLLWLSPLPTKDSGVVYLVGFLANKTLYGRKRIDTRISLQISGRKSY